MGDDNDEDPLYPQQQPPHRRDQYDLNSKIMLTAIISLSVVVVIVTILHIYARCILRRQARRRAAMRQLRLAVSQAHSGAEPPKTGLDPAVIASLPIFVYKQTNTTAAAAAGDEGPLECAVCLSILEDDEMARLLPNCKHTFHAECIDKWLGSQSTCPICRTEAQPRLSPEEDPQEPVAAGGGGAPPPTAPPLERVNSTIITSVEGTSNGVSQGSQLIIKVNESSSRLSSFRRMLGRERLSPRIQSCGQEDGLEDLERQ